LVPQVREESGEGSLMKPAVSLEAVSKHYRRGGEIVPVIENFDLQLAAGEFVALMGPSGSGKTTLLNLIGGLDKPDSGRISVAGERIDNLSRAALARWRARHAGFVFQFYNLMPTLSAARNVEIPLLLTSLSAAERRRKVSAALELVGLTERRKHKPGELSGGQQQRVAIARALIADPTILICDEPTGDLDRHTADEVLNLLQVLNRQHEKTIVMVTHDPKAAGFATRQLQIDKGQLTGEGLAPMSQTGS
jgi:putative ABC transport system ATP-binding protein